MFQRSFIQAGVLSSPLPFQTKAADLHTELLRVLKEAMKVSRGKLMFFCTVITINTDELSYIYKANNNQKHKSYLVKKCKHLL